MQQQAYINATIDIRIPTEVENKHFGDVDKEKETLADYLYNNPNEILEYDNLKIRNVNVEVE
ncbi:DUF3113 family protein [Staphylococcus aureus]|uniref:DUF3113 family protein n=1 Tax=Staphylococcus phage 80 TaxID=2913981 RepID=A7YGR8_9CAUD|nr:DUF3113 family protein [Staphylococcus aureus]YP_009268666.1 hypothetical protein BCD65_gp23 [Staphylococcus phage 80]ABJ88871.1 conserved hypothetical protein [Staphylococcus phage 80]EEV03286.2 phage protein [Staphylococcus aureus subsp. aureus 55/2053]EEV08948.1 conserved hypothetical protein [Staphylococcus aureus subsp. aureus 68-397]EEV13959.1 conserved hypothetical protein [Staphylococcus aureus subsp. aureus M876]EFB43791.1 hypothetical protein SARG_02109 [Staphylococcus aureus sub